jgi:hypothetical protein
LSAAAPPCGVSVRTSSSMLVPALLLQEPFLHCTCKRLSWPRLRACYIFTLERLPWQQQQQHQFVCKGPPRVPPPAVHMPTQGSVRIPPKAARRCSYSSPGKP